MKLFQTPMLVLFFLAMGCKEEYEPQVKSSEQSVLVVDGVLNANGPTVVRLTRTFKLNDTAKLQPETGARLTVEGDDGSGATLFDTSANGMYGGQLFLNPMQRYRLRIVTRDGNEYASDFAPVLKNPPIDSINWKRDAEGVTVYVNTHNLEDDTRHYRWEYEETWHLRSSWETYYKLDGYVPIKRHLPQEQVRDCWPFYHSKEIFLATTTQLSSDVVFERPLIQIPEGSEKLSIRYSVLVRQYALDKAGYEFYQLMKKNTESLGSIFDAQPTELTGNVHALSNTADKAIGYITAASVQQARIFITKDQVPDWKFSMNCSEVKDVHKNIDSFKAYFNGEWLPVYEFMDLGGIKYGSVRPKCTDCTLRGGGPTVKPDFW